MSDLITKLAEVQKHLKAPKDQYNSFSKFNYRSAEGILEAVKPLLHERGLVLIISDTLEYIGDRHYVKATARVGDGESWSQATAYAREGEDRKGYDPSQLTGATSSYARKYALNGLFAIDDAKDADTDDHTAQRQQGSQETPPNRRIPATPAQTYGDDASWRSAKDELINAIQAAVPEIDGEEIARVMARLAGFNSIEEVHAERMSGMAIFAKGSGFLPYYTDEIVPVLAKER